MLPVEIAKQVAFDLVEGDIAKEAVDSLQGCIGIQKEIISLQDSTITTLERNILLEKQVVSGLEADIQRNLVLQEQLRGKVDKNRAYAVGFGCSTAVAVAGTILIFLLGSK